VSKSFTQLLIGELDEDLRAAAEHILSTPDMRLGLLRIQEVRNTKLIVDAVENLRIDLKDRL
jgi:hypothetical protein